MKLNFRRINFSFTRRNLILSFFVLVGMAVIFCYFLLFLPWNAPGNPEKIEVTIVRGMAPQEISVLLKEKGVIREERNFLWTAKLLGVTRKLQAGRYLFQGRKTNFGVLRKLYKGRVITEQVTFPEGTRATKIASILRKELEVDSTRFVTFVNDTSFCHSQGIHASTLEGYLYPDTYRFHLNSASEEILERMVSRFNEIFVDSLRERAEEVNMSIHQVVTLASIVEGEAALESEREIIAALYLNRLERNMLLQADPTIQYIIEDGPRRLLKKDLQIDSPYNTYIRRGLPPGPVNNPGLASILAVLYPAPVNYLYMVANGDGSHTFSRTMQEHLKAKKRFDLVRKRARQHR